MAKTDLRRLNSQSGILPDIKSISAKLYKYLKSEYLKNKDPKDIESEQWSKICKNGIDEYEKIIKESEVNLSALSSWYTAFSNL